MKKNEITLNIEKIKKDLSSCNIQNIPIFYYNETDSTNERAKDFYKEGGTRAIFIAEKQTAGRGRMGRRFESDGGVGVYISFLLFPDVLPSQSARLTVSAAVSLSRAVEALTGYIPKIKWVNDLQMNSKKVAGILTEGLAESESHLKYAIVGIGVNVYKRDFSDEISSIATSIEDATGKRISREELISTLIKEMFSLRDFASDIEYYREHSSVIGKDITVFKGGECFDAHALDVTDDGELSVRLSDGSEVLLFSGEISVRNK